jgi:cellulose synthase/poly-beta-1,6-N-acetylglucosamine synthase-like glycosyltransferase
MTGPFRTDSVIEDFEVTIVLRNLGWDVRAAQAHAHTTVPATFRDLWRQRIRWGRGGVDECRRFGWTPGTRRPIVAYGIYGVSSCLRLAWILMLVATVALGLELSYAAWGLVPLGLCLLDRIQSMWRLPDRTWRDVLLAALLIPEDIYGLWLEACTARAVWLSYFGGRGSW